MDNQQPLPPNSFPAPEMPTGPRPEQSPMPAPAPERAAEAAPAPGGSMSPPPAGQPAGPKLTPQDVAAALAAVPNPVAPVSNVPLPGSADDIDVIEPEWVAKAEEVVVQHQGDPYSEEEAIEDRP